MSLVPIIIIIKLDYFASNYILLLLKFYSIINHKNVNIYICTYNKINFYNVFQDPWIC